MQFVSIGSAHKSLKIGDVSNVELADFMVITGPNGSGKSNLLEALSIRRIAFDDLPNLQPDDVRIFRLGELTAANDGPVQGATFKEPWANVYNQLQGQKQQAESMGMLYEQRNDWVKQQLIAQSIVLPNQLTKLEDKLGHPIIEATLNEFNEFGPLIAGVRDPFAASIAELFLTYNARWIRHQMAQWRYDKNGTNGPPPASDESFFAQFGPKPWELLSETLRLVGLNYTFDTPPDDTEMVNFEVLLHTDGGPSIRAADLSSGERVLLAIAMSLFTGSNMGESIKLPQLLLLDEADASLHPAMVKSLLTVIQEIFVARYSVRVLLATHSPSTVALAPESSLYVMAQKLPRLQKTSTDAALKLLTVGISALSVKLENRRQIFVESEYDQGVLQGLFSVLKNQVSSDRSAEFIAVGKKDVGGGCDQVKRLVKDLRAAGNDTIFGIIDRDNRQGSPPHIHSVEDRYSIENLVLDPLLLGVFLLRELIVQPAQLGLTAGTRSFELNQSHAAGMIGAMSGLLGFGGSKTPVRYVGGFSAEVPSEFLEKQGHDLEAHVVDTFAPLKRYKQGLLLEVVRRAAADVPAFVPSSVVDVFEAILQT